MAKSMFFPQFQGENSEFKEPKKLSPFCDLLTALCHSKLYFCNPNLEVCLLVNQRLYKTKRKILNSRGRVMFPKFGEKTLQITLASLINFQNVLRYLVPYWCSHGWGLQIWPPSVCLSVHWNLDQSLFKLAWWNLVCEQVAMCWLCASIFSLSHGKCGCYGNRLLVGDLCVVGNLCLLTIIP